MIKAKDFPRSSVTMKQLGEPPFHRLIRRVVLSFWWFPLTWGRSEKLEQGITWLLAQPGLIGSTWERRLVWKRSTGSYAHCGLIPQRAVEQMKKHKTCTIADVDHDKQRVRLRFRNASSWVSCCDLVHLWRLVSWAKLPPLPKGVRRILPPPAVRDMHV